MLHWITRKRLDMIDRRLQLPPLNKLHFINKTFPVKVLLYTCIPWVTIYMYTWVTIFMYTWVTIYMYPWVTIYMYTWVTIFMYTWVTIFIRSRKMTNNYLLPTNRCWDSQSYIHSCCFIQLKWLSIVWKTTAPQQVIIILVYIWMLKLCKFQLWDRYPKQ